MKSTTLNIVATSIMFALLVSPKLIGQVEEKSSKLVHYSVLNLGTLGGTVGYPESINNAGWVSGWSTLPGDQNDLAVIWRGEEITDLGTLGGPNSAVGFPSKNDHGLLVGFSQTPTPDPLGENWNQYCNESDTRLCQGTDLTQLGFEWEDGVLTAMPTLGGDNGLAAGINNRSQVVGWAENSTQDPTCMSPQVLDFEAVIWQPGNGQIRELRPLSGDPVGAALAINDNGQVVGLSGTCGPPSTAIAAHALLWQDGSPIDLGSLGGVMNNVAYAINNRGQVVGSLDLTGDATAHAFYWKTGVLTDLGTLPGDFFSAAFSINSEGQAVGESCDVNFNCRGFVWQNGVMTDLNTLISQGSSLELLSASDINDRGEIAGVAYDSSSGAYPGFLLTPCDICANGSAAPDTVGERPRVILPDNVREWLRQQRGFGRFGIAPIGAAR